jgi:hypothetical protein
MAMAKRSIDTQLSWLGRANVAYGLVGLAVVAQFSIGGAWKSFLAGWIVAVINMEILKRLGMTVMAVQDGGPLSPLFYLFLVAKFLFWGAVIALFSLASWVMAVPFVIGTATLIVAGFCLGLRELMYAR